MTEEQLFHNLKKIISAPNLATLIDTVVIKNEDGSYELFGKYLISHTKDGYEVTKNNCGNDPLIFGFLQNAVTWATLDKRNKIHESNRVLSLDQRLSGLDVSTQQHARLYKSSKDIDAKMLYLTKLQEDRLHKRAISDELRSYVDSSKEWQLSRFKKETAK